MYYHYTMDPSSHDSRNTDGGKAPRSLSQDCYDIHMRSRILVFSLVVGIGSLLLPYAAHAATIPFFGPIIPPENPTCPANWMMLIVVINNIIRFLITLAIVFVAPLMIAYAGFLFVVNPVNASGIGQAKTILQNTIIGIVLALSGYLIVGALMAVLYNANAPTGNGVLGAWDEIINWNTAPCLPQTGTTPGVVTPSPGIVTVPSGCPTCVSLASAGLTCKTASSCTLDQAVANKLVILKNNFSGTWTVTEAFPPTVTHSNPCHTNGTCIDAGFRGDTAYTDANVAEFATDARSAGLRPVFETVNCSLRDQARARGIAAYCVTDQDYGHITGNHFSVYAN